MRVVCGVRLRLHYFHTNSIIVSFLNNAARITEGKYIPESEDVLRARLQTIGVEEHRLIMETGVCLMLKFLSPVRHTTISRPRARVGILRC